MVKDACVRVLRSHFERWVGKALCGWWRKAIGFRANWILFSQQDRLLQRSLLNTIKLDRSTLGPGVGMVLEDLNMRLIFHFFVVTTACEIGN